MYHLTVTAKSYPASTTIHVSLWDTDSAGKRTRVRLSSLTVPTVQGGLFEATPAEYFDLVLAHLAGIRETWVDTHQ